jgi:hypothetical protein
METSELRSSENVGMTPEKLAVMKLKLSAHNHTRDVFSEPTTPTGARKSFNFANGVQESSSRSMIRSKRQISRSSQRATSFVSTHRNKMSMELSTKAESKLFALMELMASASREASLFKEYWARIAAERESFGREREEMLEELTEVSQELERKSTEHHRHGNEAAERNRSRSFFSSFLLLLQLLPPRRGRLPSATLSLNELVLSCRTLKKLLLAIIQSTRRYAASWIYFK